MAAVVFILTAFSVPKGWVKAGSMAAKYETGTVNVEGSNRQAAYLKSVDDEITGFGTLMQQFSAAAYKGKRLQFSARVRTEQVKNRAGLWMRIDQHGSTTSLAFDNMEARPVKGDTEWTRYNIVLDVPEPASLISFGVLLSGTGQVWITDVALNAVDGSVPTTAPTRSLEAKTFPLQPVNLSFQQ